jgi:hypothetical protein
MRENTVAISVAGSVRPALVEAPDAEIVSAYQWFAVRGPRGVHAAAEIAGHTVLMEELVFWTALVQGVPLSRDGCLCGDAARPLSNDELKIQLESTLRASTLAREIHRLLKLRRRTAIAKVRIVREG